MPDYFDTTTVFLFDVHTSLQPLLSQNVPAALRFIIDPALYRQAYSSGQKVSTKNLDVAPLNKVTIKQHLFWAGYVSTPSGAEPDYWAIQMPFVCRPRNATFSLESANGIKAKIDVSTYLFSLGWATTLEFSLDRQKIPPQSLIQLSGAFRSGERVFRVDGHPSSLSEVFRWCGHWVTSECFQGFQNANDMIRLPRYMVLALANYSGPAQAYKPGSDTGMPPATRAIMHSMLLGRNVDSAEIIRADKAEVPGFLLTRLRHLDYSITYFDVGTLLAVQDALTSTRKLDVFLCFASNIKNFLVMINVWLAFQTELQRLQPGQASANLALINPDTQMRDIKQRYKTQFTQRFYTTHSKLKLY